MRNMVLGIVVKLVLQLKHILKLLLIRKWLEIRHLELIMPSCTINKLSLKIIDLITIWKDFKDMICILMVFKDKNFKNITKVFIIGGLFIMEYLKYTTLFITSIMAMIMICIDLKIECMFVIAIVMLATILNLDGMFPIGT